MPLILRAEDVAHRSGNAHAHVTKTLTGLEYVVNSQGMNVDDHEPPILNSY